MESAILAGDLPNPQNLLTMPRKMVLAITSTLCNHKPKHIPHKSSKSQNKHKQQNNKMILQIQCKAWANSYNTDTMNILFCSQVQRQCNLKQTSPVCWILSFSTNFSLWFNNIYSLGTTKISKWVYQFPWAAITNTTNLVA